MEVANQAVDSNLVEVSILEDMSILVEEVLVGQLANHREENRVEAEATLA